MTGSLNSNPEAASEPEVRFLVPEDAPELMRIRHRAISECATYFGTPVGVELHRELAYYRRQLFRYRARGHAALLGAWEGGELIGITGIRVRTIKGRNVGLIYSTFVEEGHRGLGIGKVLVEVARESIQAKWGLRHCVMNVEVHNENALKLYQECGFEITGKQDHAFWIDGIAHDVYVLEWKEAV